MSEDVLQETTVASHTEASHSDFAPLLEELYRKEVLDARRMSPEDKLIFGERLFRWACAVTLEGIRFQNPTATAEECRRLLHQRIALGKQLEAAG